MWCCSPLLSQNFNKEVEPGIKQEYSEETNYNRLTASAKNLTDGVYSLRYEWKLIYQDTSANRYLEGRFTLKAYEFKDIEEISLPTIQEGITVLLLFYDQNDELISTFRKVINNQQEEIYSYTRKNEGIKLTGFVTEDTKTKAGKDFYDFFYQKYNLMPEKSDEIIAVSEKINFGRTTRIVVMVKDQEIYQFFAQPKLDYLRDQADKAIIQLNKYLQYLKNRNEYRQY